MLPLNTLTFLTLIALGLANPISKPLKTRDGAVCNAMAMPTDKKFDDCESTLKDKKNELDKDGNCVKRIGNVAGKEGCVAYCEQTISLGYGQEKPYDNSWCQAGEDCKIDSTKAITTTQTWEIHSSFGLSTRDLHAIEQLSNNSLLIREDAPAKGPPLKATFEAGASYSYSKTVSYSDTSTHNHKGAPGVCGYFTFIPFVIESCGVLTQAETKEIPVITPNAFGAPPVPSCNKKKLSSDKGWCNKVPIKDENGIAIGKVLFIIQDCATNAVKGPEDKDSKKIYDYPGVSIGYSRNNR